MYLKEKRVRGRKQLNVINSDVKTIGVCIDNVEDV